MGQYKEAEETFKAALKNCDDNPSKLGDDSIAGDIEPQKLKSLRQNASTLEQDLARTGSCSRGGNKASGRPDKVARLSISTTADMALS